MLSYSSSCDAHNYALVNPAVTSLISVAITHLDFLDFLMLIYYCFFSTHSSTSLCVCVCVCMRDFMLDKTCTYRDGFHIQSG